MSEKRTWLEGPQLPGEKEDPTTPSTYAGENLGLPQTGPGSIAGLAPRLGALLIDWLLCYGLAVLVIPFVNWFGGKETATLIFFFIFRTITIWLFAQSLGHAICGIGVARVDKEARVGLWRAALRTFFTLFLFPPIIQDTDSRGMHDRATGTVVIRSR